MTNSQLYDALKNQAKEFPQSSGVYLMRDPKDVIIYVGKAKVLRNRVRSYFSGQKDIKTTLLMRKVASLEFITTQNEYEALILENSLIKKYNPRFNINLKDGKSYPVIRITREKFPRVFRTRRVLQDGSEYFGPYPNVKAIDIYLDLIETLFPLRKCSGVLRQRETPCLYYHIGRCKAPCVGMISEEDYKKEVSQVKKLLSGKTEELVSLLKEEMLILSQKQEYEKAAKMRDSLIAVEALQEEQKIVDFNEEQRDYIAMASSGNICSFVVFQMRGGRFHSRDQYRTEMYGSEEEALSDFILLFYRTPPPRYVFVNKILDSDSIESFFANNMGVKSSVRTPERGRHAKFMKMAQENAKLDLDRRLKDRGLEPALEELQKILNLPRLPKRIEGFDIAQLHGKDPVASMVSFWMGLPDKPAYRKYHMKSLKGQIDDFKSIREVVARRYSRVVNENKPKPDLILVDGGKGQVSSARGILDALGLKDVPLVGLAKREEELFLPDKKDPVVLPLGSSALRVLINVRDEAHRFATSFNKRLRQKRIRLSTLEGIEGIGPKRSQKILKAFGGLEGIKEATYEEISKAGSIPLEVAETVKAFVTRKLEIE